MKTEALFAEEKREILIAVNETMYKETECVPKDPVS